jgi:hypothetical protein
MEKGMKLCNGNSNLGNVIGWLENLKSEDIKRRVFAVSHLKEISTYMGAQNTKEKIIPFLAGIFKKNLKMMMKKFSSNLPTKWST